MQIQLRHYNSRETIQIEVEIPDPTRSHDFSMSVEPRGLFSRLDGSIAGLFEHNRRLYVLMGNDMVAVTDTAAVSYSQGSGKCVFRLSHANVTHSIEYSQPDPPVSTPFHSESEEDANFGLWLYNVLSSDERKAIVLNSWRQGLL